MKNNTDLRQRITLERFMRLFTASRRSHTITVEGKTRVVPGAPRDVDYAAHLTGFYDLGIAPAVSEDETCTWGVIDIGNGGLVRVAGDIAIRRLPLLATGSRSGGVHAWIFADSPVPVSLVRKRLGEIAAVLGYPKAEIFPNLDGNVVNLPYFAWVIDQPFDI